MTLSFSLEKTGDGQKLTSFLGSYHFLLGGGRLFVIAGHQFFLVPPQACAKNSAPPLACAKKFPILGKILVHPSVTL